MFYQAPILGSHVIGMASRGQGSLLGTFQVKFLPFRLEFIATLRLNACICIIVSAVYFSCVM